MLDHLGEVRSDKPVQKLQDETNEQIVLKPDDPIVKAYLDEMALSIPKVRDGHLSSDSFQVLVDEAKTAGVPVDEIRALLQNNGVEVVSATQEHQGQHINESRIQELINIAGSRQRQYSDLDSSALYSRFRGEADQSGTPTTLMIERERLTDDLGKRFKAHGISKGTIGDQFRGLLSLLDKGVDLTRPFYIADLFRLAESQAATAVGASGPYDTGGFITLFHPSILGKENSINELLIAGVAGVLVNREWYDAISDLQRAYPEVKFIRADAMVVELKKWIYEIDSN